MLNYCRTTTTRFFLRRRTCIYNSQAQACHRAALSSLTTPQQENNGQHKKRRLQQAVAPGNGTTAATTDESSVVDCNPHGASSSGSSSSSQTTTKKKQHDRRLPPLPQNWQEFPNANQQQNFYNSPRTMATTRILKMALKRVMEPPTLHLMAAAACATLGIGAVEATIMCQESWPINYDAAHFVFQYTVQNLFPSVVWETQDAKLICTALGMDPALVLRDLAGHSRESAILLLQTKFLSTARFFFAGFMMIAQLFRAATISMETFQEYEQRIEQGREPPLTVPDGGLIVRLCGRDSHVSEVSLQRMGTHLFPVFEHPERVKMLVHNYSQRKTQPVYWCVPPGLYWRSYSWERFPAQRDCFLTGRRHDGTGENDDKILVLEADATNGNDPLSIGTTALDLTLEDASQGFRRILQRYRQQGLEAGRDFRSLRVYLGNSMEVTTTGGGHAFTIRHRVRYAKEMDVLIDSRAPVLSKILEWCQTVTAAKDRKLFFQTSSREYFLNLQSLLKEYGYEIYDPLDLRMLPKLRETMKNEEERLEPSRSFLGVLLEDPKYLAEELDEHGDFLSKSFLSGHTENLDDTSTKDGKKEATLSRKTADKEMLRKVARLAKLPRLVHMETTAETVNAVEALIAAGEVDAGSCCALLDRQEGVAVLESTLQHRSGFVQSQKYQWQRKPTNQPSSSDTEGNAESSDPSTALKQSTALQIICSSSIHDDILRQVRWWARLGYQAADIQKEIDAQYQEILHQSHTVQKQVTDSTKAESALPQNTDAPDKEKKKDVPDEPREE